jgi:hypothetical protein
MLNRYYRVISTIDMKRKSCMKRKKELKEKVGRYEVDLINKEQETRCN